MPARDPRSILHLDMDAFYAAVEVLDDPSLRGKPVIVGGSRRRGVVSSASYEARRFGVHSAQPTAMAARLCPDGVFLPVRMARYVEVSRRIFAIFRRYTPLVEPISIDEAFLDVTGSRRLFGPAEEIARGIRRAVKTEEGLTVSAGIASCKFVAKIASDLGKPDGLVVVPHDGTQGFLDPLEIGRLWGVGQTTRRTLARMGVRTIGDLRRVSRKRLEDRFGKHGLHLHLLAHGIDERPVSPPAAPKSMGREETFGEDLRSLPAIRRELLSLSTRVARRVRSKRLYGRTITLKVKYDDFVLVNRSTTLARATDDAGTIHETASDLLRRTEAGKRPVRLLGVYLSQLQSDREGTGEQIALLGTAPRGDRQDRLNEALDRISERFGERAILPGTLLEPEET